MYMRVLYCVQTMSEECDYYCPRLAGLATVR